MTSPRILYYAPLLKHERFALQQARDLPNTQVATLESDTAIADLFDTDVKRIRHSVILGQLDRALRKAITISGARPGRRAPIELAHLSYLAHHCDLAYSLFLYNAMDLLGPTKLTRTPLVVHVGGSDITTADSRGADYLGRLDRLWKQAALVFCGSQFLLGQSLERGADADRCEVHYLGVDIPVLEEPPNDHGGGALKVTAISRLHPVKGIDRSLKAFAAALGGSDARLTIIGDGPLRTELQQLSIDLGIGDQVDFRGYLTHDEVFAALRHTDIFIQHNVRTEQGSAEGCGGTILEASAHRVPVIGTVSGGTAEAVVDGITGFLVPEEDIDAMADRLRQLADDPALRRSMGDSGRRFVEEFHNSEIQAVALAERLCTFARV